ncbi:MAG: hypothetical protein JRI55_31695 [Deltaproteobacteria bacterium]|jgi:UDP-GlcNAc:undecaprenyl-phosphate GlcNAc-1-phosphate transferase|nr:hypothetical protein [Deltaproteobacteria bacterium]
MPNFMDLPMNRATLGVLFVGGALVVGFGSAASMLWLPPLLALVITLGAILLLRRIAPRLGLIDRPTGHKTHTGEVPTVGGLAMFLGLVIALPFTGLPSQTITALLAACGILVLVGALDDRLHLPVWVRFGAQISAALVMIHWGGVVLTDLGHLVTTERFTLGRWSVLMTVVATVGVINSMNMADGLDGLAGSLALTTFVLVGLLAANGHPEIAAIALPASAALVAFLAFNAPVPGRDPRGRLFMGDAGSMMLGLLISWCLIALAQGPERAIHPVTALWLFAVPLLDTLTVMLRRIHRGHSPFAPDREHFHHILVVAGYSKLKVVLTAVGVALGMAGFGLLMLLIGIPEHWQFMIALATFVMAYVALRRAWRLQRWLHKKNA